MQKKPFPFFYWNMRWYLVLVCKAGRRKKIKHYPSPSLPPPSLSPLTCPFHLRKNFKSLFCERSTEIRWLFIPSRQRRPGKFFFSPLSFRGIVRDSAFICLQTTEAISYQRRRKKNKKKKYWVEEAAWNSLPVLFLAVSPPKSERVTKKKY